MRSRLRLLGRVIAGVEARSFLVGGPVRDILLGRESPDLDIAVEGDVKQAGTALAERFRGRFVYHARFLTGTVALPDGGRLDIAHTRTESYSRPAVLPKVRPAGIEEDLPRRDFSINAMALELSPHRFGRLYDPLSGRADLADRLVRVLHPKSFIDDPTRVFRAIRFAIRLEFEIEAETLDLMRSAITARLPGRLTPERILYELRCFCAEELAYRMFEAAIREGLFIACFGRDIGRDFLTGFRQVNRRTRDPELLFLHVLAGLPDNPEFPITREQREAARYIRQAPALRARLTRVSRPSTLCQMLRPVPSPALQVIAAESGPMATQAIDYYLEELAGVEPLVTGRDLKALGLRPGPEFGRVIDKLRAARLDGRVKTRDEELTLARRILARRGSA